MLTKKEKVQKKLEEAKTNLNDAMNEAVYIDVALTVDIQGTIDNINRFLEIMKGL